MSQLSESQYRVLKHGTYAEFTAPSFHTQNQIAHARYLSQTLATAIVTSSFPDTVFSLTALPFCGARDHRRSAHGPTGASYTKAEGTTGGSYTASGANRPVFLAFVASNCTKLSCTKDNNSADVFRLRQTLPHRHRAIVLVFIVLRFPRLAAGLAGVEADRRIVDDGRG